MDNENIYSYYSIPAMDEYMNDLSKRYENIKKDKFVQVLTDKPVNIVTNNGNRINLNYK